MSKASDAAREWWMNNPSSLDLTYSEEEHPSDELVIGALSTLLTEHAAEAVKEERSRVESIMGKRIEFWADQYAMQHDGQAADRLNEARHLCAAIRDTQEGD